mmetsp:Transcript_22262/g.49354  ORF Transcript_22262/g.49354 Transcript_22262/m.49354 type:complete len:116 (-) Transcript_22262:375-722(-)
MIHHCSGSSGDLTKVWGGYTPVLLNPLFFFFRAGTPRDGPEFVPVPLAVVGGEIPVREALLEGPARAGLARGTRTDRNAEVPLVVDDLGRVHQDTLVFLADPEAPKEFLLRGRCG